jgi:trans-aconitate methyltransferase
MSEISKKILSFYNQHIDEHGSGPKAVGWNDVRSQTARFAALCKVGDLEGRSVLDVGCGLGDFHKYLIDHYESVDYTGIDINPRYIESARQLYPDVHFEVADFEEYAGEPACNAVAIMGRPFDYVCASGVFAVKIPNYKDIYFGQIKKMFTLARKGIAFTMLDAEYHNNDKEYAAYSVEEVRAFCLSLADDVVVYHDYLPHDFTVILRR